MPTSRRNLGRSLVDCLGRQARVSPHRVGELGLDALHRVQGVHCALHHHRVVAPAHVSQLALVERDHVAPGEGHASGGELGRWGQELRDREEERRLPAAGLADDREELPGCDLEIDPVDRAHVSRVGEVVDERPRTSSSAGTPSPRPAEGRVPDLVERVVQQGERRPQQGHRRARASAHRALPLSIAPFCWAKWSMVPQVISLPFPSPRNWSPAAVATV